MARHTLIGIAIVVLVSGVALLFIPVFQRSITTLGVDEYESHRPLFGTRAQSQEVVVSRELHGVGAILVNLRHAEKLAPVAVTVIDITTGSELAVATIAPEAIVDDQFAVALFSQPLRLHQTVRVTFAAPQATAANPIGIRLHPDTVDSAGIRFENDEAQLGTLAIAIVERVSLWRYIYTAITLYPARAYAVSYAFACALLVTVLSLRLGWHMRPPLHQKRIEIAILLTVAIIGIAVRLIIIPRFHGVSGGDPYNYLFITQKLATFDNPFEGVKRLPGYPLLLMPAFVTSIDDIWWMRFLSAIAAGIGVLLTGLLARRLKLPWPVQLLAVSLIVFQKDFLWTSFRPEAYTVYTALLLASLVLFFSLHTRSAQLLFGLVVGYAAMTRQEGFVIAALLGLCAFLFWRPVFGMARAQAGWRKLVPVQAEVAPLIKNFAASFGVALLVVLPFFVSNFVTFGNPLYTEYFEGKRLQIVDSWNAFLDSLGATWGVLGSMWRPVWDELFRIPLNDPLLVTAALLTLGWWLVHYSFRGRWTKATQATVTVGWAAILIAAVALAITNRASFNYDIMAATAGVLLVSPLPFIAATGWRGVVVLVITASQILIALWFHPFPKHYQQVYPLLTLFLACAIVPQARWVPALTPPSWPLALASRLGSFVPLALVLVSLSSLITTVIDKYNNTTALDHVVYQAVQRARVLPGPHGFDQAYLAARLYFIDAAAYYTADEEEDVIKKQQWVRDQGLRTFVTTNSSLTPTQPDPTWQKIDSFKAEGRKEFIYESTVYEIP